MTTVREKHTITLIGLPVTSPFLTGSLTKTPRHEFSGAFVPLHSLGPSAPNSSSLRPTYLVSPPFLWAPGQGQCGSVQLWPRWGTGDAVPWKGSFPVFSSSRTLVASFCSGKCPLIIPLIIFSFTLFPPSGIPDNWMLDSLN